MGHTTYSGPCGASECVGGLVSEWAKSAKYASILSESGGIPFAAVVSECVGICRFRNGTRFGTDSRAGGPLPAVSDRRAAECASYRRQQNQCKWLVSSILMTGNKAVAGKGHSESGLECAALCRFVPLGKRRGTCLGSAGASPYRSWANRRKWLISRKIAGSYYVNTR